MALPITQVELSNGQSRRGIMGSIGTPAQNISWMMNSYLNNTWIYNATGAFCDTDATDKPCITRRGGVYDIKNSSSYTYRTDVATAGGDPSDTARTLGTHIWDSTWATDALGLGNISLPNYPLGMPGFDFGGPQDTQGNLGLGMNSTLLERLKKDGHIASRSWSYWWGVDNPQSRSAMDGQIVLGGYDAAKTNGAPFTQPLQRPSAACWSGMTLSVTNMLLNFPNGTSKDMNPSSILTACIKPDFPAVMTIPAKPYYWNFQDITQTQFFNKSRSKYWWNPVFPSSNVYPGDLSIQVQGGPAVNIPNDVLIVPDQFVDKEGAERSNSSAAVLLLGPLDDINANDQLYIGMQFFSGAYLTVNYENQTWSIWSAKATTDTKLTTLGDSCEESTNITITTPLTPNLDRPIQSGANSTPVATPAGLKLSTGVIAGIAAGGGGAVIILGALIAFCILKKRKSRKAEINSSPSEPNHDRIWGDNKSTMIYRELQMQEMAGSQVRPYELEVDRRPVEMPHHGRGYSHFGRARQSAIELPTEH